jgi:hypothetical protein
MFLVVIVMMKLHIEWPIISTAVEWISPLVTYLGLPLSTGRLQRVDIWPLIDKYSGKLTGLKTRYLWISDLLSLTRSVLMVLDGCENNHLYSCLNLILAK